jgi:hypothetical protein
MDALSLAALGCTVVVLLASKVALSLASLGCTVVVLLASKVALSLASLGCAVDIIVVPADPIIVSFAPGKSVVDDIPGTFTVVGFKVSFEATFPIQHTFFASCPRMSFIHLMNLLSLRKNKLTHFLDISHHSFFFSKEVW